MYMCARFHEIPAKGLQDIKETKCYGRDGRTPRRTDGQREKQYTPLKTSFFAGGIKNTENVNAGGGGGFIS